MPLSEISGDIYDTKNMDRHGFIEENTDSRSRSIGRRNLRAKLREQLKGYSNVRGELQFRIMLVTDSAQACIMTLRLVDNG